MYKLGKVLVAKEHFQWFIKNHIIYDDYTILLCNMIPEICVTHCIDHSIHLNLIMCVNWSQTVIILEVVYDYSF